jgi:hypothetical protein
MSRPLTLSSLLLLAFLLGAASAPGQSAPVDPIRSPAPTTSAARPVEQLFADDTLSVPVPPGWRVSTIGEDTRMVVFALDAPHASGAVMAITTTPQTASLTQHPEVRLQIGNGIIGLMKKELAAKNLESVDPPRIKRDDGFYLRIEDSYRSDGKVARRLNVYRVIGIHLVMATITSYAQEDAGVAADFKLAEQTLSKVKPNKLARVRGVPTGQKPGLFRQAKVKLTPTKGWLEERTDKPEGIIATFRQQVGGSVVTVRAIPMDAQKENRASVIARVATEDITAATQAVVDAAPPGATVTPGEITTTPADGTFELRAVQKTIRAGLTFRVETRVRMVGNVVLSITNSSTELRATDGVTTWADDLARTAEPFGPAR